MDLSHSNAGWADGARSDRPPRALRNQVAPGADAARTRIVCIGGGTGLPVMLRGLARRADPTLDEPGLDITAVVAMADDGGSSGRLRRSRGLLPPGDIRNCLVALAGGQGELCEVFQYRFTGAKGLAGHAVGNLVLAALAELKGDFLQAVQMAAHLLGAKGRVLPSTLAPVQLVAHMADETCVVGESNLSRARGRVAQVSLSPTQPPPADGLLEAIAAAELITIGPGSLYSSIMPNLLVAGVAKALRDSRAPKVLVGNLMTEPGETDGMSCVDHLRALIAHVGPLVDAVLVNVTDPSHEALDRYARQGSFPVTADRRALLDMGLVPVEADLLKVGRRLRHDGRKLARCVISLARSGL